MIQPLYVRRILDEQNRMSFRIKAPAARSVSVELGQAGPRENQEITCALEKGADGVWTGTAGPLIPGFHYYSILVDGFRCADPAAPCYYGWGYWISGVDIPDPQFTLHEPGQVPHGEVRMHWYRSSITGTLRRCLVYTPPGYDTAQERRYPVLYLQHGSGEAEVSWTGQGRANFILDNLIAAGRAHPMLIVMDNGYAQMPGTTVEDRGSNRFADVFVNELLPAIDSSFRTVPDRRHRAIAGLSMGAGQCMQIGLSRPDLFAAVGAMSGGGRSFDPATSHGGFFADPHTANTRLDLLWIGCGRQDGGFEGARKMHETLESHGIRHVWYESDGAHVWGVWRRHLADLAPRLFLPD